MFEEEFTTKVVENNAICVGNQSSSLATFVIRNCIVEKVNNFLSIFIQREFAHNQQKCLNCGDSARKRPLKKSRITFYKINMLTDSKTSCLNNGTKETYRSFVGIRLRITTIFDR